MKFERLNSGLTESELDDFLAQLDRKAKFEYDRLYKRPVSPYRLHLLEAIAGLCMLVGSMFFLLWWLYPVYQKIVGGIR